MGSRKVLISLIYWRILGLCWISALLQPDCHSWPWHSSRPKPVPVPLPMHYPYPLLTTPSMKCHLSFSSSKPQLCSGLGSPSTLISQVPLSPVYFLQARFFLFQQLDKSLSQGQGLLP